MNETNEQPDVTQTGRWRRVSTTSQRVRVRTSRRVKRCWGEARIHGKKVRLDCTLPYMEGPSRTESCAAQDAETWCWCTEKRPCVAIIQRTLGKVGT